MCISENERKYICIHGFTHMHMHAHVQSSEKAKRQEQEKHALPL